MKDFFMNATIFVAICLMAYLLFSNLNFKEGLETQTNINSGIAGGAAAYGAVIKSSVIKSQDTLLISKYRKDYETVVLNMDDLINNIMLETALSIDQSNPLTGLKKLADLNQSKIALNGVMKFIDSSN